MARCWSCNKPVSHDDNYCYGCHHLVCYPCTQLYGHAGNGAHGRKKTRTEKVRATLAMCFPRAKEER